MGVGPRATACTRAQRIVAWLLHRVPHTLLPWVTDLSVWGLQEAGYRVLHVYCCDAAHCHAAEHGLGAGNACVLCPCELSAARGWELYTMYGDVAMYVSNNFTTPELPLF